MLYKALKRKKNIALLFSSAKIFSDKNIQIRVRTNNHEVIRILFAMSKKLASKPIRNMQIRRMRVIARNTCINIQRACDIAIVIRAKDASFYELDSSYQGLLAKARLV